MIKCCWLRKKVWLGGFKKQRREGRGRGEEERGEAKLVGLREIKAKRWERRWGARKKGR